MNQPSRLLLTTAARRGLCLSAGWHVLLAAVFLLVWLKPGSLAAQDVKQLIGIMLVEFLVIHASPMLGGLLLGAGSRRDKGKAIAGLALLYGLLALGFALSLGSLWPLLVIAVMMAEKLSALFAGQPDQTTRTEMQFFWGMSALWYLLSVMITVFLPMPRLGITPAVIREQAFATTGHWVSQPQSALAAGVLYFLLLALTCAVVAWRGYLNRPVQAVSPGHNNRPC
ncbi:MAG TPA: hypothetical protein VIN71_01235 [Pseudomonadales bacterium]